MNTAVALGRSGGDALAIERPDEEVLGDYGALLRWRAGRQPRRLALIGLDNGERESIRLTYQELDARVRGLAAVLQARGAAGERVLVVLPSDVHYTVAFLACLYAGATAVTTVVPTTREQLARLGGVAADAQAKLVLATSDTRRRLEGRLEELAWLAAADWIAIDDLPFAEAEAWIDPGCSWEDIALLQYTSGSTSSPRGVMVTHRNLLRVGEYQEWLFDLTPRDFGVTWLPQSHDMGLIYGVLQPLFTGYPACVMTPMAFLKRPMRWLKAISRYQGTISIVPNFAYDLCVEEAVEEDFSELDLRSFTQAINGAEPVRKTTMDRFAATFARAGFRPEALSVGYGMAESTLAVTGGFRGRRAVTQTLSRNALASHLAVPAGPGEGASEVVGCGRFGFGVEVVIADPQTLEPLPANHIGEILVAGEILARGYWRNEEATTATFRVFTTDGRGPFLRTGDLGFLADDAVLYVTGRCKDLIIINGRNLAPQDVELAAEGAHPDIRARHTAAFSVEHQGREMVVIVAEIRREAGDASPGALGELVARKVASDHQAPVLEVVFVRRGECPKTTSGKIQRQKARTLYLEGGFTVLGKFVNPLFATSRPESAAA